MDGDYFLGRTGKGSKGTSSVFLLKSSSKKKIYGALLLDRAG